MRSVSEPQHPTVSERRVVTVLFADVAGFTAMSENLDPETVTDAMNTIFNALGAEVEAVGGHVDKVIGDSLMALFGAPIAHEDDPLRAVRAAMAMHRAVAARQPEIQRLLGYPARLRIGIHSGLVVWGAVGPLGHARPTVMGDVVNLASRLQRAASEGKILISEDVYRQVRGAYACTTLEPILVKGKTDPVAVYEVVEERDRPESLAQPPFTNRDDEVRLLHDLLARAARGRAQVVVVVGEPGIGKTRLVGEFIAGRPDGTQLLQTACPPYGGISLGPLADLFRQLTGLRGMVSLREIESHVPLGDRASQAAVVLARLFNLAEVPAGSEVPHETALLMASETIRRMLVRPTIVWIEDLHWADAGTRELLPFMLDRLTESPLLLIVTQRPDAPAVTWGRRAALTTLQIDPLSSEHASALLAAMAGAALPRAVEVALLDKAAGNPFYLTEMISTLRRNGTLAIDDRGQWRLTRPVDDVLPDTVQGAVRARLDRLAPGPQHLIQLAAVLGSTFQRSLLEALAVDGDAVGSLHALEDADIVSALDPLAPDPEYRFAHPLVREVAYASLVVKERTAHHHRIAETLQRLHPNADDLAKTLGTHYARGADPVRAVPYLTRAGEQAAARYATREAIELLEEARKLAEEAGTPALAVTACELLGDLYVRVHDRGPKAMLDAWTLVRTHTDPVIDPVRHARAAIRLALAFANDNQHVEALPLLREAEALIPLEDPLWSDFHRVRALTLIMETQYREALDSARQAVSIANRVGTLDDRSRAYSVLAHPAILPLLGDEGRAIMRAWVAEAAASGDERLLIEARHFLFTDVWTRGVVDADVLRAGRETLNRAVEHGWTRDEAAIRLMMGWATFITGAWPEAHDHIARAHHLIQLQGGRLQGMYHILLPLFRAHVAMGAGRLDEARQIFEEALPHARSHAPIWLNHDLAQCLHRLGDTDAARLAMERSIEASTRWRCIICGCQADGVTAEFYASLGEADRAREHADRGESVATDIGHIATRIRVRRARARLAMDAGDANRAVQAADEAVTLGAQLPLIQPLEHAQSLIVLATAQWRAGEHSEALSALQDARGLLERLGAAWHLEQVDTLARKIPR